MDTFIEQLVAIKKTAKTWLILAAIIIVSTLLFITISVFLPTLSLLAFAGICYGAYKLYSMLLIEYEYIITNTMMDIDKIIAKSSRKRIISFEISNIQQLEKYNKAKKPIGNFMRTIIACNEDDEGAYFLVVDGDTKEKTLIVFSPDERTKKAMVDFLPKYISNSAFKD